MGWKSKVGCIHIRPCSKTSLREPYWVHANLSFLLHWGELCRSWRHNPHEFHLLSPFPHWPSFGLLLDFQLKICIIKYNWLLRPLNQVLEKLKKKFPNPYPWWTLPIPIPRWSACTLMDSTWADANLKGELHCLGDNLGLYTQSAFFC